MVKITKKQLMDAIRYHKLNYAPSSHFVKEPFNGCITEWTDLNNYNRLVAIEHMPYDYCNDPETVAGCTYTSCTEDFYKNYVLTLPEES